MKRAMLGLAAGAGLMYFYDPRSGRRRRAHVRDLARHARRVGEDLIGKARRDAANRAHGLTERMRHTAAPAGDAVITARIRAQIGRLVSHPSALDIDVRDGRVHIRGPVLTHEADAVVKCVRRVAGVTEVVDQVARHRHPDIPSLQGDGSVSRGGIHRAMWPPVVQVGAAAVGAALFSWGALRGGLIGKLAAAGGALLAARGLVNRPVPQLFGVGGERRGRGIVVDKTIAVRAPIEDVYDLWSRVENFPKFMHHIREIRIHADDHDRSHWVIDGPGGTALWYDAEFIRRQPPHAIAWRTLPAQSIEHSGEVRFESAGDFTRVHVRMEYCPPAGVLGHAIGRLLGFDPKSRMNDDLIRMKALLENGRTRAHHVPVTIREVH